MNNELSPAELQNTELFALKIIVMALLSHTLEQAQNPDKLAQEIVSAAQNTAKHFDLRGAPPEKSALAREAMSERIEQMILSARNPKTGQ